MMIPKTKLRHLLALAASSLVAVSPSAAQATATYTGPNSTGSANT